MTLHEADLTEASRQDRSCVAAHRDRRLGLFAGRPIQEEIDKDEWGLQISVLSKSRYSGVGLGERR